MHASSNAAHMRSFTRNVGRLMIPYGTSALASAPFAAAYVVGPWQGSMLWFWLAVAAAVATWELVDHRDQQPQKRSQVASIAQVVDRRLETLVVAQLTQQRVLSAAAAVTMIVLSQPAAKDRSVSVAMWPQAPPDRSPTAAASARLN